MAKKSAVNITESLKAFLGKTVTTDLLREVDPELMKELRAGVEAPRVVDLIVRNVVKLALDPKKPSRWAIELIMDRVEGRPATAEKQADDGRRIEEKLDDIGREHLDGLAKQFAKDAAAELASPDIEEDPDRRGAEAAEVPRDRPDHPKEAQGKPSLAPKPAVARPLGSLRSRTLDGRLP